MKTAEEYSDDVMKLWSKFDWDEINFNQFKNYVKNYIEQAQKEAYHEGQSSPKIKQLEWKKSGGEYWEAITQIGAYSITLDFGIYEALYDMDNDVDGEWGSLAKAKASVQADFEKRVRECLE